jgi:hypothetical protein
MSIFYLPIQNFLFYFSVQYCVLLFPVRDVTPLYSSFLLLDRCVLWNRASLVGLQDFRAVWMFVSRLLPTLFAFVLLSAALIRFSASSLALRPVGCWIPREHRESALYGMDSLVVGQWLTPPLPTNLSPSYFPLFIPVFKFIQLLLLFPIISLSCTCAFPRSLRILSLSLLHRLLQRLLPSIHRC